MSKLDETMGLPEAPKHTSTEVTQDEISADNDFDAIRLNLTEVTDNLRDNVLPELIQVASSSQRADHYRAVADIAKTIVEANKALIDLNTKKVEITGVKPTQPINQNVLVVGSTAELLELLRDAKIKKSPRSKIIEHDANA